MHEPALQLFAEQFDPPQVSPVQPSTSLVQALPLHTCPSHELNQHTNKVQQLYTFEVHVAWVFSTPPIAGRLRLTPASRSRSFSSFIDFSSFGYVQFSNKSHLLGKSDHAKRSQICILRYFSCVPRVHGAHIPVTDIPILSYRPRITTLEKVSTNLYFAWGASIVFWDG